MVMVTAVRSPRYFLAHDVDVRPRDMEPYELLDHLLSNRWQLRVAPGGRGGTVKDAPAYSARGERVFFVAKGALTVSSNYMRALAEAEDIFATDILLRIPHGRSEKYYAF
eukprot:9091287-Pyramimonas_sp.AAC.1